MSEIFRQNDDGTWRPAEPIGWREEHNWIARLILWVRGTAHCGKPGRAAGTDRIGGGSDG